MCSETSPPRLSFSNDLPESPINHHVDLPRRCDTSMMTTMMDSNSEFEFSFTRNSMHSISSSADELFSNGIILPIQIQNQPITKKYNLAGESAYSTKLPPRPCSSSPVEKTKKQSSKESHSRSFFGFGRSKSLNCDTKKNLFSSSSSLPRSNSTGSATNPKKTNSRDYGKNHGGSLLYSVQKTGSGKGYGGSYYGDGFRVSPVLNVPTPKFNLGSFLRVGKAKKTKN